MFFLHGLFVDDVRPLPKDVDASRWTIARSFHDAIVKLEQTDFREVSLDHDLASFYGEREMTGYDILMWLVRRKMDGLHVPSIILVHSANPVACDRMRGVIHRYLT